MDEQNENQVRELTRDELEQVQGGLGGWEGGELRPPSPGFLVDGPCDPWK